MAASGRLQMRTSSRSSSGRFSRGIGLLAVHASCGSITVTLPPTAVDVCFAWDSLLLAPSAVLWTFR